MYSVQCKVYSVQCTMYNVQLYSHKNWFQMPCLRFLVAVLTFLDGRPSDDSNSVNGRLIVVKTSFSKFGQKPPKCCRVLQSKREKPLTEMSGFEIWIPPWLMGSSSRVLLLIRPSILLSLGQSLFPPLFHCHRSLFVLNSFCTFVSCQKLGSLY